MGIQEPNTSDLEVVLEEIDPGRFGLTASDPIYRGRVTQSERADGFEDAESLFVRYSIEDVPPGEIPSPEEGPMVDLELLGPMDYDGTTTAFHEHALPRSALESADLTSLLDETVVDGLRDGYRRTVLHEEGRIITDTYLMQSLPGWFLEVHGARRTVDPDPRPFMRSIADTFRESFIHGSVDVDLASVDPFSDEVPHL